MCKRLTETTVWDDDWFYELPSEYKLFWFYIKDNCDHAGIWKPKIRSFKSATDVDVDLDSALISFNKGKQRIRILDCGYWYIEDFFYFQYAFKTKTMNLNNRVHHSIFNLYMVYGIPLSTVKGLSVMIPEKSDEKMSVIDFESILGTI